VVGLFKTKLIKPQGPWRTVEQVEIATLEWVDWYEAAQAVGPRPATQPQRSPDAPGGFTGRLCQLAHRPLPAARHSDYRLAGVAI